MPPLIRSSFRSSLAPRHPLLRQAAFALCLCLAIQPLGCSLAGPHEKANVKDMLAKPGQEARDPESMARRAGMMLSTGNTDGAMEELDYGLKKFPDNAELLLTKGSTLMALGNHDEALTVFRAALSKNPSDTRALLGAGEAAFHAGRMDIAKEYLEQAVAMEPQVWQARVYLGIILNHDGQYEAAAAQFSKAMESSPHNPALLNNMGVSYLMLNRNAQAVETLTQAVRVGGATPKTYNNLGIALARLGRIQEALEAFKAAGDEHKAYNNLGYVLYLQGNYRQAQEFFERAAQAAPSYYELARDNLKRTQMANHFGQGDPSGTGLAQAGLRALPTPDARPAPLVERPIRPGGTGKMPTVVTPPKTVESTPTAQPAAATPSLADPFMPLAGDVGKAAASPLATAALAPSHGPLASFSGKGSEPASAAPASRAEGKAVPVSAASSTAASEAEPPVVAPESVKTVVEPEGQRFNATTSAGAVAIPEAQAGAATPPSQDYWTLKVGSYRKQIMAENDAKLLRKALSQPVTVSQVGEAGDAWYVVNVGRGNNPGELERLKGQVKRLFPTVEPTARQIKGAHVAASY